MTDSLNSRAVSSVFVCFWDSLLWLVLTWLPVLWPHLLSAGMKCTHHQLSLCTAGDWTWLCAVQALSSRQLYFNVHRKEESPPLYCSLLAYEYRDHSWPLTPAVDAGPVSPLQGAHISVLNRKEDSMEEVTSVSRWFSVYLQVLYPWIQTTRAWK